MKQLKDIVWTYKASFELCKNTRQGRVWRRPDEAFKEECLASTFKSARMAVMVRGAIAFGKKSELVILYAEK
jgi:hypothetical protein